MSKDNKKEKLEKILDALEPEKAMVRNLQKIADKLDEVNTGIKLIKDKKIETEIKVNIPDLQELRDQMVKSSEVENQGFTKILKKLSDRPAWHKDFPDIQKVKVIEAAEKKNDEPPKWLNGILESSLGAIGSMMAKVVETLSKLTFKIKISDEDRARPLPVIQIDPVTGKAAKQNIQVVVSGGGGGGTPKVQNKSGIYINPATEETQEAILAALGGQSSQSNPSISNVSMASKNAIYSLIIPDNAKQITVKLRDIGTDFIIGWDSLLANFQTISAGSSYGIKDVNLVGKTIYFKATDDNQTAEIETIQ